jgi:predicted HicB family RNase H-like nuclease
LWFNAYVNAKTKSCKLDIDLHFRAKMAAQRAGITLEEWLKAAVVKKLNGRNGK